MTIAHAFDYLLNVYGSQKSVASKVGLSSEMVREFLSILKLPAEVQELVEERTLDSIDVVKQIVAVDNNDLQIALAEQVGSLSTDEVRDLRRLIKTKRLSIPEALKELQDSRPESMNLFVLDLNQEVYDMLVKNAKKQGVQPAEYARDILVKFLSRKDVGH